MELEEIEVVIAKNGQVQIKVRGVKGRQCLALTKELEGALGGQIVARQLTPEAYEACQESVPDQQRVWNQ